MKQSRRDFLKRFSQTAGCFVATASIAPLMGCSRPEPDATAYSFPQGVASADPQADAIILWTRAVPADAAEDSVALAVQLARDEGFAEILSEQEVSAERAYDYTVRCSVNGLDSNQHFYYRFIAPDGAVSRTGRTRTAPAPGTEATLTAAVFSCQHYEEGHFSAYRRLLLDDEQAPADRKIDVILHLGDFIYEVNNRRDVTDLNDRVVIVTNADGSHRRFQGLPSKGAVQPGIPLVAESLEDYREHYRNYLSDPDLLDARAAFPWVCTWDDHEFYNDAWQSFHPSGPAQRRKVSSNQAWFEYVPAALTRAPAGSGGDNPAQDFSFTQVEDVALNDFDSDYLSREPNNLAAIASMSIYRSLSWGDIVEFLIVDGRSYRGPRGVDESIQGANFITSSPVPARLIETQNAGRTANDGDPPDTVEFGGVAIANHRKDAPRGSMLGAAQKAWLKDALRQSPARWKLLCNNVPLMRFGFDMRFREYGNIDDVWWHDTWDGYPIERRELMKFIREQSLTNVVSVAGDRHAHFAGLVYDDFDGADPVGVLPEFVGSGVTSGPRMKNQRNTTRGTPELDSRVHFDGTKFGYDQAVMPALNAWLLFGADAAARLGETGDPEIALRAADPAVNPHLSYADTDGLGYFVAHFSPEQLEVEFVTILEPLEYFAEAGPPVRRRIHFTVPAWTAGEEPQLSAGEVEGEPPLMALKSS
jgi:alkaline phosphatase D